MPEHGRPARTRDPETQAILDNHCRLRRVLERIQESRSLEQVRGPLDDLRLVLAAHFQHEEGDDGLFAVIDAQAPHLHPRVQECQQEHARLTAELDTLHERARTCPDGEQVAVLRDVDVLVRRLRDHEERETEMFVETWNDDVGELD